MMIALARALGAGIAAGDRMLEMNNVFMWFW